VPTLEEIVGQKGMTLEDITGKGPLFSRPKGSVREEAAKNLKKIPLQAQQQEAQTQSLSAEDHEKHLKNALWMVKKGAAMAPFLAAAPFTGGASLGALAAIGAGSGFASGAINEGLDAATLQPGERGKSATQVARSIGFDTVLGLGGEVGFRYIAKIGGQALEQAVLRTAAKTAKGKLDIQALENSAHQSIQEIVAPKVVGYKKVYEDFMADIARIPRASKTADPAMKHLAGSPVSGDTADLFQAVSESLTPQKDALGILHETPLFQKMDVVMRAESKAMQMAFDLVRGGHKAEAPVVIAVEKFATGLRKTITDGMNVAERKAFESAKAVTTMRMEAGVASDFAEQVAKKAIFGAVGGMVGHLPGATAGVAAQQMASTASKKYGAAALEWLIHTDKMSVQKAVKEMTKHPELIESYASEFAKKIPKGILKSIPVQMEPALEGKVDASQEK
jgi:hypothetical protein